MSEYYGELRQRLQAELLKRQGEIDQLNDLLRRLWDASLEGPPSFEESPAGNALERGWVREMIGERP